MPGSSPALLLCDGITVVARYDSDTMDSRFVAIDLPGA
jgi:hypothetical protein